jgi:hypothetical protein
LQVNSTSLVSVFVIFCTLAVKRCVVCYQSIWFGFQRISSHSGRGSRARVYDMSDGLPIGISILLERYDLAIRYHSCISSKAFDPFPLRLKMTWLIFVMLLDRLSGLVVSYGSRSFCAIFTKKSLYPYLRCVFGAKGSLAASIGYIWDGELQIQIESGAQ